MIRMLKEYFGHKPGTITDSFSHGVETELVRRNIAEEAFGEEPKEIFDKLSNLKDKQLKKPAKDKIVRKE